ncbi:hypothetical protein HYH02_004812 [Chlamydomonas schloesseri]|uniref:EF-hand domain-containing protein n=1 Tax=Chlamydomonas schloesseri TaxID=2026947 RepID=A0A836B851_9CHLO|nr:hypothetical protein HYH02_004812 [Chlamydomonas schloesseri]|eukprot:KAG2450305.1 hypothetical protein HYH02_004812 [Chlamydomonas schloesseri]
MHGGAQGVPKDRVDAETKHIMTKMDTNGDNRIQLDEFVAALHDLTEHMGDAQFAELLAGVVNTARSTAVAAGVSGSRVSDGAKLSPAQVQASLAAETRIAKLRLCFAAMDADKSGFIDLDEFRAYVSKTGASDASGSPSSPSSSSSSSGSSSGGAVAPAATGGGATAAAGGGGVMAEAEALLAKMDGNGDKQVSEQEFMCAMAEFRHTVSDEAFGRLVEGIFSACAGRAIASNVLKEALEQKAKLSE